MKVYSFLAVNGPLTSFTADVKLFFNYLASNQGFPASSQYMLSTIFSPVSLISSSCAVTLTEDILQSINSEPRHSLVALL